jgi:23S rRNA A1618 N6-methylase RlmF
MGGKDFLQAMLDESAQLRARAAHCRELIETTTDPEIIEALRRMAEDFEEEAVKLEEAARRNED